MKKISMIAGSIGIMIVIAFSCTQPATNSKPTAEISTDSLIKKGKYLVTIMACNDCHTPLKMGANGPERDEDRLLSGHPEYIPLSKFDTGTAKNWALLGMTGTCAVGPWGASFSGNLTSDATGIGNWTEEQFRTAITKGKFKGLENSRPLLPPMPWENYVNLKDEDIKAIFAYLKSTKPVKNHVPAAVSPDKITAYIQ